MRILGLSGSLRAGSINTATIKAAGLLAAPPIQVDWFAGAAEVPPFNPDLEDVGLPPSVLALREAVGCSDALLICSPEYAHGVSSVMKTLLDWLVASYEFPGIATALVNTAPRSFHADSHLREILGTMSADLVDAASVTLPPQAPGSTAVSIAGGGAAGVLRRSIDVLAGHATAVGPRLWKREQAGRAS